MNQTDYDKAGDMKTKALNFAKEGKIKEAIEKGMQDVQEKFDDIEINFKPILGAAAVVGSVGLIVAARRIARKRGLFGAKKVKTAGEHKSSHNHGTMRAAMKKSTASRRAHKSVAAGKS